MGLVSTLPCKFTRRCWDRQSQTNLLPRVVVAMIKWQNGDCRLLLSKQIKVGREGVSGNVGYAGQEQVERETDGKQGAGTFPAPRNVPHVEILQGLWSMEAECQLECNI